MVVFAKREMEEERNVDMMENTPRWEIKQTGPHIVCQFPENMQKYPRLPVSVQTIKMINVNIPKHEFTFLLQSLICPKSYSFSKKIVIQKSCGQKDFNILKLCTSFLYCFRWRVLSQTVGGEAESEQQEEVENTGEMSTGGGLVRLIDLQ